MVRATDGAWKVTRVTGRGPACAWETRKQQHTKAAKRRPGIANPPSRCVLLFDLERGAGRGVGPHRRYEGPRGDRLSSSVDTL